TQYLTPLVDLQRLPRVQHGTRGQIRGWRRIGVVGHINDDSALFRPRGGEARVVVRAPVARTVLEKCVLPARAVAPRLPYQLQVAVETVKASLRAQELGN